VWYPVQRNCCMSCLLCRWIHQMRCALDYMRIVIHARHEWAVRRMMDLSKTWMYCLPRGMGSSELTQPPHSSPYRHSSSSTSDILGHLFEPTLVLEECFWGGYFIMCWYTLIVTLTYSEKGLCYRICNFIVRSLLSYMYPKYLF
jgi:hypothetical protein